MNIQAIADKLAEIQKMPEGERPSAVEVLWQLLIDNLPTMRGLIFGSVVKQPGIDAQSIAKELNRKHTYISKELGKLEELGLVGSEMKNEGRRWWYIWYPGPLDLTE